MKFMGAAHFTLRCGRRIGTSGDYQMPLVALVCNFGSAALVCP
jgi:Zn-dependent oligopeptidase